MNQFRLLISVGLFALAMPAGDSFSVQSSMTVSGGLRVPLTLTEVDQADLGPVTKPSLGSPFSHFQMDPRNGNLGNPTPGDGHWLTGPRNLGKVNIQGSAGFVVNLIFNAQFSPRIPCGTGVVMASMLFATDNGSTTSQDHTFVLTGGNKDRFYSPNMFVFDDATAVIHTCNYTLTVSYQ